MGYSPDSHRLDGPQRFPDDKVWAQFFHPGGNLRVTGFRVEIVGTDDAAKVRPRKPFLQQTRDPTVTATAHSMDVQDGLHLAKLRLFP